jgi:hypothetical protein
MIKMPAMSGFTALKRRNTSEIAGNCCYMRLALPVGMRWRWTSLFNKLSQISHIMRDALRRNIIPVAVPGTDSAQKRRSVKSREADCNKSGLNQLEPACFDDRL